MERREKEGTGIKRKKNEEGKQKQKEKGLRVGGWGGCPAGQMKEK